MEESMKKKLDKAIVSIADKLTGDIKADEALKYTQATLNIAHTINVIKISDNE